MLQTGLKYTQYKVDDGSFVYKLEPAGIENLITFATETKTVRGRYAVRQLVNQQMEREKIRRRKGGTTQQIAKLDLADVIEDPRGYKRGHNEIAADKKVVVERVRKDFFGRTIAEEREDGKRRRTESGNEYSKIQPNVWVRFHEGYSNAVRRPAAFTELLGRI
jgi:chromosome transmission fidelity protein 18